MDDVEHLFDGGNSGEIDKFKKMIRYNIIDEVLIHAQRLLDHVEI